MINKVLFDLDGTFIDSAHDLVKSANDLYLFHKKPLISFEDGRAVASDGIRAFLNLRFDEALDKYASPTDEFIDPDLFQERLEDAKWKPKGVPETSGRR